MLHFYRISILNLVITALLLISASSAMAQGITVTVDGQKIAFTGQEPVLRSGTVLVPLRGVFEKLGAAVTYEAPAKRIIATKGETAVVLVIGSDTAYINGDPNKLLLPANVMNGSTMVPLRFVSEALGAQVAWKSSAQMVEISTEASNTGNLPTAPGSGQVTGRVTGVFPQLDPPLLTLMVNGQNSQITLARDVVVLVKLPDGKSVQAKLADIRRGDQVTVKRGVAGEGILIESSYGEKTGTLKAIKRLDHGNYQLTLDDGTVVEMAAEAPVTMAGRTVLITDIQPGETVVIRTNPQTKLAYGMAVATGGETDITPPAAVKVTSFTVSPTGYLKLGSVLNAVMKGTPGGTATFEIPGVKGAESVLMTESSAGTYTGKFTVPAGTSVKDATVLGTLKVGGIAAPTIQASGTVTVDSIPPVISGFTPADGATIADVKPLIYATISDNASGINSVTLTLDGKDVTTDSTITPAFFNYRPASALEPGPHTAVVRVTDEAGNTVEKTVNFRVSQSDVVLKDVTVSPAGPYRVGDTITVTAKAASGGSAGFSIGSVITGISMKETSTGVYKGSYTVKNGDSVEKAPVTVTFKPKNGQEVSAAAASSITISAGRPAAPIITSPVPGAAVDSPVVISGKAAPNAKVNVVVGYSGQLLVLPVEGTIGQVEVTAGEDGKWQTEPLNLSKPAGVSKIQYSVAATVIDASGQESESASVSFKRK